MEGNDRERLGELGAGQRWQQEGARHKPKLNHDARVVKHRVIRHGFRLGSFMHLKYICLATASA